MLRAQSLILRFCVWTAPKYIWIFSYYSCPPPPPIPKNGSTPLLGDRWETQQQPLKLHWALIVRLTVLSERPAATNRNHRMTKRVHQNWCVCWQIVERSLKDWWDRWALPERSPSVHWKSSSLRDHWKTTLNQFKIWWKPWRPQSSLKDHWEIMEDLGDLWVLTERPLRDLSKCVVSQRSRLSGKGGKTGQRWDLNLPSILLMTEASANEISRIFGALANKRFYL